MPEPSYPAGILCGAAGGPGRPAGPRCVARRGGFLVVARGPRGGVRNRGEWQPAAALPVARVVVDVALAHLDRPFDYRVPGHLDELAVPGVRLRVRFAGRLVDDLLNFSQLNRTALALSQVDMRKLVAEARRSLAADMEGRTVEWQVGALPPAWGDPALLRQAVLNLLQNAVKYTRGREPAVISVSGEERDGETVFAVRDNGIGFDMTYVGKLFGVFQRLHRAEDFEGTGIGLALTKRVIER
ncbi:MAG: hypothetical protein J0H57_04770, partial [Rhodospirillales bacterium]|nr:hypothetical protein [Rhodospirillales bacterium]